MFEEKKSNKKLQYLNINSASTRANLIKFNLQNSK